MLSTHMEITGNILEAYANKRANERVNEMRKAQSELAERAELLAATDPVMPKEISGARIPSRFSTDESEVENCGPGMLELMSALKKGRTKYLLRSHFEAWVPEIEEGYLEKAADLLDLHLIEDSTVVNPVTLKGMFTFLTCLADEGRRLEDINQTVLRKSLQLDRDWVCMMAAEMRNQRIVQRRFPLSLTRKVFAYSPQLTELTSAYPNKNWHSLTDLMYLLVEAIIGSGYDYVASNSQLIKSLSVLNDHNCPIQEALDCKRAYQDLDQKHERLLILLPPQEWARVRRTWGKRMD